MKNLCMVFGYLSDYLSAALFLDHERAGVHLSLSIYVPLEVFSVIDEGENIQIMV